MKQINRTDRLLLKILEPNYDDAARILDFQYRNDPIFQRFEPEHSEDFFTLDHQMRLLEAEYNAALRISMIRFWIYRQEFPFEPIATMSFRGITQGCEQSCKIGYKMDLEYWHHGYMTEAVEAGIALIFREIDLHRIIATIMPENLPSIRLAKRVGFHFEGLEEKAYQVNGRWEDHERWALINPNH